MNPKTSWHNRSRYTAAWRKDPRSQIGGTDESALHTLLFNSFQHQILFNRYGPCSHLHVVLRNANQITIQSDNVELPITGSESEGWDYSSPYWWFNSSGHWAIRVFSSVAMLQTASNGLLWQQHFVNGEPQTDLIPVRELAANEVPSTIYSFTPDPTIFDTFEISFEKVYQMLRHVALLTNDLPVTLRDERTTPIEEITFHFSNGTGELVHELNANLIPLHNIISGTYSEQVRSSDKIVQEVRVEIAIQYTHSTVTTVLIYCNLIKNPKWYGVPIESLNGHGLRPGLIIGLNAHLRQLVQNNAIFQKFNGKEIQPGLTAIINVSQPNLYAHARSRKKNIKDLTNIVSHLTQSILAANPDALSAITKHCLANRH